MEIVTAKISENWNRQRRAYIWFLVCGLCLLINVFAYLPGRDFWGAEAIEFIVTIPLIPVFLLSGLIGIISVVRLGFKKDKVLLVLMCCTVCFVAFAFFRGETSRQVRQLVDVLCAAITTVLSLLGLAFALRR
jgi:hypothetical protein